MSAVRILPAATRVAQPWKNGGGVTSEVLVHPSGAGFDDFVWRISIADVASDGPFSRFPGVDRVLTVLAGALDLVFAEGDPVRLSPNAAPHGFAGDVACFGRLVAGPVRDLNVMVRRGTGAARVARLHPGAGLPHHGGGLVLFTAPGTLAAEDARHRMAALDAAWIAGDAPVTLLSDGPVLTVQIG